MENAVIQKYISPLVAKELFKNEEDAVRELVLAYISGKITDLTAGIRFFEEKHKMQFQQFQDFVKMEITDFKNIQGDKKKISRLIMEHEDDLQDWKAKREILESWLGIH